MKLSRLLQHSECATAISIRLRQQPQAAPAPPLPAPSCTAHQAHPSRPTCTSKRSPSLSRAACASRASRVDANRAVVSSSSSARARFSSLCRARVR